MCYLLRVFGIIIISLSLGNKHVEAQNIASPSSDKYHLEIVASSTNGCGPSHCTVRTSDQIIYNCQFSFTPDEYSFLNDGTLLVVAYLNGISPAIKQCQHVDKDLIIARIDPKGHEIWRTSLDRHSQLSRDTAFPLIWAVCPVTEAGYAALIVRPAPSSRFQLWTLNLSSGQIAADHLELAFPVGMKDPSQLYLAKLLYAHWSNEQTTEVAALWAEKTEQSTPAALPEWRCWLTCHTSDGGIGGSSVGQASLRTSDNFSKVRDHFEHDCKVIRQSTGKIDILFQENVVCTYDAGIKLTKPKDIIPEH